MLNSSIEFSVWHTQPHTRGIIDGLPLPFVAGYIIARGLTIRHPYDGGNCPEARLVA